jgi:hypothetical protein
VKQLLLLLLLPAFARSQEVTPVLSNDYLKLIHKDSLAVGHFWPDTMNSIKNSSLSVNSTYNAFRVGRIRIRRGVLNIDPFIERTLTLSGEYNTRVEIKRINQAPALQTDYVQGRSQNGNLVWRGAETGEMFSYGPAISSLEYDGGNYIYDENGKLVAAGTGNGRPANAYNNSIFRTASLLSQFLRLQAQYRSSRNLYWNGTLKLGHSRENTFIRYNNNTARNLAGILEAKWKNMSVTGGYTLLRDNFSNSNRYGFLHRAYQNALLTPVSFDVKQNARAAGQQAYGNAADNPVYLLTGNGNRFGQTHETGSLTIERKFRPFSYKITQSAERLNQQTREGYKPGTAFFPLGIAIDRTRKDINYLLKGNATYEFNFDQYQGTGTIGMNYSYTSNQSALDYSLPASYRYQRSAHDASLSYLTTYRWDNMEAGVNLVNKMYASNTTVSGSFFLPNAGAFVRWDEPAHLYDIHIKLSGSYNRFNSELPVGRSYAQNNLLFYTTQQAFGFFPVTEVRSIDGLEAIRHTEWGSRLEISYKNNFTVYGEFFNSKIANDIFPVMENGALMLRNIAGHRNRGFELGLTAAHYQYEFNTINTFSFFTNTSKVTDVRAGYDQTPMAGFSNIYTAVVKDAPLGSIVGAGYLRDENNNIRIGADGFPLVNSTPGIIGNPLPDFIMKMTNSFNWKKWYLDVSWEWKKGGDMWNGTQAVLDYYGRSATSASARNTTGYIFDGVLENKQRNNIPVAFYDVNAPVEQNRWTRYGHSGVGEEYIQRADVLRLNNISIRYKQRIKKYIQQLTVSVFAGNLIIYTSYKGADPSQLLYDYSNTTGLDFFNLPSVKSFGCNVSIQF